MKNSRRLLFRILTVLVLLAIAAAMYVIGRGHTLYFDNTSMEYNGQTIEAPYRIDVYVGGERVAKLKEDERGTCTNIGQKFSMDLEITKEKDDEPVTEHISLKLPFSKRCCRDWMKTLTTAYSFPLYRSRRRKNRRWMSSVSSSMRTRSPWVKNCSVPHGSVCERNKCRFI